MGRYLLQRLGLVVATLLLASLLVFGLLQLLPGDPALALAGEQRDPAVIEYIRQRYHLDQPLPLRYLLWLGGVLQGDLGQSVRFERPVAALILQKFPVTLELASCAMIIALMIGIPTGVLAAVKRDSVWGSAARGFALWGLSTPNFVLGVLFILLFSRTLHWLPASGYVSPAESLGRNLAALVMPSFVLGNAIAAVIMRHTRAAMLQALGSDYVRTARAKGLSEARIVLRHALPNALQPVITLGALEFGALLSGTVLTEQVFSIPGFGKLIVDAIFNRDYPILQGGVLVTATVYTLLNLAADLLYAALNPRLRG